MALTDLQYRVLNIVTRQPGMTKRAVAWSAGTTTAQASRALNALAASSYLERRDGCWYPAT